MNNEDFVDFLDEDESEKSDETEGEGLSEADEGVKVSDEAEEDDAVALDASGKKGANENMVQDGEENSDIQADDENEDATLGKGDYISDDEVPAQATLQEEEDERGEVDSQEYESDEETDSDSVEDSGEENEEVREENETTEEIRGENVEENCDFKGNKSAKKTLIYIFLAIILVIALVLGYFVFFSKSVVGTWKIDKGQENMGVAAIIFDSDGKATYTTGSYVVTGSWKKSGDDLTLDIKTNEGEIFSGKYNCRVSAGFTDRTMELRKNKEKTLNLRQYKMEEAVHPVSNFVPKEELLGKWSTGKSGGYTYEFKDNGIVVLNKDNITITLTYYFDDESITFMQYYLKDSADDSPRNRVRYSVNGDSLKIGGMSLKKVKA